MHDLKWSPSEKAAARKAFDQAQKRELEVVIREVKNRANRLDKWSDLWELERYLTECGKEVDSKYDYRYSVLLMVFGRLIREGLLSEQELHGLAEDNLGYIRLVATL
jgi:hypothetical protein